MSADEIPLPPEGYEVAGGRGAFTTHNGPYFNGPSDGGGHARQAFYALARHCNGLGIVHGGMLSAFLDGLLASAAARGTGLTPITMNLTLNYLDIGRKGEWILGEARMTKHSRDIAFVEGRAYVGGKDLTRATGVFRLMRPRG